ncbi:MAG: hypothetical protein Q9227_001601 [Pyrenula ochraceoflavens]
MTQTTEGRLYGREARDTCTPVKSSSAGVNSSTNNNLLDSTSISSSHSRPLSNEATGRPATSSDVSTDERRNQVSQTHFLANPTTSYRTLSPSAPPVVSRVGRSPSGSTLYNVGSFQCSESLDLAQLASLLLEYLKATGNTLDANVIYLGLKLHVAAPTDDPGSSPSTPPESDLPRLNYTSSQFDGQLGGYIYSPAQLLAERANLNQSWYSDPRSNHPVAEYFTTHVSPDGIHSTPDGWPCGQYLEVTQNKRLVLNWESIDSQLAAYDLSPDSRTIFRSNFVVNNSSVSVDENEDILSGCFYKANITELPIVNSSWAFTDLATIRGASADDISLGALAANLTSCGISPSLSQPLSNMSADMNMSVYQSFSDSSIWSWAPGEPRNSTHASNSSQAQLSSQSNDRCAVLDVRAHFHGHWRVEDCTRQYHVACRVNNLPYSWSLSDSTVPYTSASNACPDNTNFSAPRTALENTYLYHYLLAFPQSRIDPSAQSSTADNAAVWVDFNSVSVETCWVTGGPDAECPYQHREDGQRRILVPVVGVIIVLILTALTLFVKCNANRRTSRKRRRGEGGWDYEGVPS